MKYLFIDEVQNVKGFQESINAYQQEGYSIFITGSNGYLLPGELATKLTGRYIEFEIATLSFSEYLGMKQFFGKEINPDKDIEFQHYITEGGFPLAVRFDTPQDKRTYVESVIQEILEKDIRKNKKIRNKRLFDKLMTYIINNFGASTSVQKLCTALSDDPKKPIRKETIYSYLSILENAKIISKCSRFDMKSKKSLRGENKYYLTDLSFYFCRNTDNRINYGPVLENIIFNYVKSCGYSVSVGWIGSFEVDFIIRDSFMNFAYIQVARTIDNDNDDERGRNITEEREYRPLESIKDGYPKYLLTMDKFLQKRNGIKHLNIPGTLANEIAF